MPRLLVSMLLSTLLTGAVLSGPTTASAFSATLDLDASSDAGDSPQTLFLEAGDYWISPFDGEYLAWNVHAGDENLWTWRYSYASPELGQIDVGAPNGSCNVSGNCSASEQEAFDGFAEDSHFTLTAAAAVDFFFCDGPFPSCNGFEADNTGGVSIQIVPESGTGVVLALGLAGALLATLRFPRRS